MDCCEPADNVNRMFKNACELYRVNRASSCASADVRSTWYIEAPFANRMKDRECAR